MLEEVKERGPLSAKELEDPGWRRGSWWMRSKGKQALEWHFRCGNLMASDRPNFERVYDVTERVLPADILEQEPVPEREAQLEFLMRASRSHGVGTAGDLADYYRLPIIRNCFMNSCKKASCVRSRSKAGETRRTCTPRRRRPDVSRRGHC